MPADACTILGWKREIGFKELVKRMVSSDIENAKEEQGVRL